MPVESNKPVSRRLDLKAFRPAGGETEFLTATLIDEDDDDRIDVQDACELPAPNQPLGDTGLTVEEFLMRWRQGDTGQEIVVAARVYGRMLYQKIFQDRKELGLAWQEAVQMARKKSLGFRLEIRCPSDAASQWCGQSLSALPFELMCDDTGFLFRKHGWTIVRRSRGLRSRPLHLKHEPIEKPRVQVAWANVQRGSQQPLDDELFLVHDRAVVALAEAGYANRLDPVPAATRDRLSMALQSGQPHVLVWIGHGLNDGSGLLLHDANQAAYPADRGTVISASDFAATVREGRVDVAFLWSCHGAGTFRSIDIGVAEALLDPERGNVAAVLASFSTLDANDVAQLSKDLIKAWARGNGDLEVALAYARRQILDPNLSWARPVLFLRTPNVDPSPRMFVRPELSIMPSTTRADRLRWLPPVPSHATSYVDHQRRLAQLQQDLGHHPIVVLEGLPGSGKTELALAMVHALRSADQDVAFVDLSGQRNLAALRQILGLLVSATPFDDDAPLMAALAGKRWTLVLDNAEDVLDDEAVRLDLLDLLSALCATGEGFRVVVTSRHALCDQDTANGLRLFSRSQLLLSPDESFELFISAAGPRLAPAQAGREMLAPLLTELGGIARAIILMANQLGGDVDVPELRRRLAQDGTDAIVEADLFGEVLSPSTSLDRRLHKSRLASALNLSLISATRQATLAPLVFDVLGNFPAGLLQGLLPRSGDTPLNDAIAALLSHQLVHLVGQERRIMMAAPVRAWAARRWLSQTKDIEAARALLDSIHRRLATYMNSLDNDLGTPSAQVARQHYLADAANVFQAVTSRTNEGWQARDDDVVASLFRTTALFAIHGGSALTTLNTLTPLAAPIISSGRHSSAAVVAFYSGNLKMRTADLAGARQDYDLALPIYQQIEDRLGQANTLKARGDLKMRTDDLAGARQDYDLALPIYQQIEARMGEANTLMARGDLKMRTDDLAGARQDYDLALPIYQQIEARLGEANTLMARGDVKRRTADLAGARQDYDLALPIYQQIEDRMGQANTLKARGDLKMRTDDLAGARQDYDLALPIYQQIEARLGEANTLIARGDLKMRTADLAGARQDYDLALPIYQQIEDRMGQANTLMSRGDLKMRTADLAGARQDYDLALPIYQQIEDRMGQANTLMSRGDLKMRTDDLAGARQDYDLALPIYQQIEDRMGQANTLKARGELKIRTDDLAGARQDYDLALPIYQQIEDRMGEANTLIAQGQLCLASDEVEAAYSLTTQALSIQIQIDDQLGIAGSYGYLARIAAKAGALDLAIVHVTRAYRKLIELNDRHGQIIALTDLGKMLLPRNTVQGLAMLLMAQAIAEAIGDPVSNRLGEFIDRFRVEGASEAEFSETLNVLRNKAPYIVDEICTWADAKVANGELDRSALPIQPAPGTNDEL